MSEKFKVVISGVSGRFPECDNIFTFKEKLYTRSENFITVNDRKWPVGYKYKLNEKQIPDATGKLKNVFKFDNVIFRMRHTLASSTDIPSRIVWEPAFEAVVDAGINPYSLDGCNVGVFMSLNFSEISDHVFQDTGRVCLLLGSNKCMMSNRVSFALNLKGPSFTNFLDMHGGLDSLALAYKYISEGFVDSAIVGASSCFTDPRISLHFIGVKLLSPDGITRTFDEFANGYGRSDGVVCYYLQRADDAKRSYGELKFCDILFHGSHLTTLIGCDEKYLKTSLHEIYRRNNHLNNLSDIAYIEMNAYGHKKMDRVEAEAIAEFFGQAQRNPLMVGSVKSNIGHTEGASGLIGVLKALLILESGIIPSDLYPSKFRDDIRSFKTGKLKVALENTKLPGHTVAVNSMGLFGNVGQAVIEKNSRNSEEKTADNSELPRILLICGRVEDDLREAIKKIETLPYNSDFVALVNDALGQDLPLHLYRGYTVLPKPFTSIHDVQERGPQNRPIWYIFSGMGSQWHGMGRRLLDLPIFADVIARCDQVLKKKGIDIYYILTSDDLTLFDNVIHCFVGITSIQIGLFEVLKAIGVKPDGIIGHSQGENACAYADGCLTLEEVILVSWARGVESIEMDTIKGMMAAVGRGYNEMKDSLPEGIGVACHNSADSCTISGPAEKVSIFVEQLKSEGVFVKPVDVGNIAYHSQYIAGAGPKLMSRLEKMIPSPKPRSSKWISTSLPEETWDTELAQYCSAGYLTNNFLNPVLFEEGCTHIPANAICIELAPHGLLQAILKRSLPQTCTNIPLTRRTKTKENLHFLLASLGKLYIAGIELQVNNLYPKVDYPVPRGTPSISPFCTWYHDPEEVLPIFMRTKLYYPLSEESIFISIKEDSEYAYLRDHKMDGENVVPPSFFMYLTWWIFSYQRNEKLGSTAVIFEDIRVHHRVSLSLEKSISVMIMVQNGSGNFEVILDKEMETDNSETTVILTGCIWPENEHLHKKTNETLAHPCTYLHLKKDQMYEIFRNLGYDLGDAFSLLHDVYREKIEFYTHIKWTENWVTFLDSLMKFQMFVDHNEDTGTFYPRSIRRLKIPAPQFSSLEKGDMLVCNYDMVKKTLTCKDIEIFNLRFEKIIKKQNYKISKYRFVNHSDPECQNIFEFITLCLQIAVESGTTVDGNTKELIIVDTTDNYAPIIKEIIGDQGFTKYVIVLCTGAESVLKANLNNKSLLIVADTPEYAPKFDIENVFILAVSPFTLNTDFRIKECYVEITRQAFSGSNISLLRKKIYYHQKPVIFFDNGEQKLEKQAVNGNNSHCIVHKDIELNDVSLMLDVKKFSPGSKHVYIMDEETDMSEINKSLQRTINQNLPILVFNQHSWGSYRNLSSVNERLYAKIRFSLLKAKLVSAYVDFCDNTRSHPVGFAYAGSTETSENFMGLAVSSLELDPLLSWKVPINWNLEDAVTVPYIYAQAYRILFPLQHTIKAKSILVNMGGEYLLTEAIIALSLSRNLNVYLTVSTQEESELMRKIFPELRPSQILCHESRSYKFQVFQQTKGKGTDIVVNCLSGMDHVTSSLDCVSVRGFYVDVRGNNCKESYKLGLFAFIKFKSFFVMENTMSDLLNLPQEKKEELHNFIDDCLNKGIVIPPRIRYKNSTNPMKVLKCISTDETCQSNSSMLTYDDKHSYLIIGSGEKDNSWFKLLQWLVTRGARMFVVCLDNLFTGAQIASQITRLHTQKKATILITSTANLDTIAKTRQLFEEATKLGPLMSIFFVRLNVTSKQISNLDSLAASKVYFIGISSGRLNDYEKRRARGSPALLIYCDKMENISAVFPYLDDFGKVDCENSSLVVFQTMNGILDPQKSVKGNFILQEYLPGDIETLSKIAKDSTRDIGFIETISLSRRYKDSKGVYPIFVLPALHESSLQNLLRRLQYPVFCASNIDLTSVPETARKLLESLNTIQPSGPVTVISEMWNLHVTLQLVDYIENIGRKYKIFALEGNPQDWKERVMCLMAMNSQQFDSQLAKNIFHFSPKVHTRKFENSPSTFDDTVKAYAEGLSYDNEVVENAINAAKIIREKVRQISQLQFPDKMLSHITLFERRAPDDKSFKLSVNSNVVVLEEPNYESFLRSAKIRTTINENTAFDWWDLS